MQVKTVPDGSKRPMAGIAWSVALAGVARYLAFIQRDTEARSIVQVLVTFRVAHGLFNNIVSQEKRPEQLGPGRQRSGCAKGVNRGGRAYRALDRGSAVASDAARFSDGSDPLHLANAAAPGELLSEHARDPRLY